MGHRIVTTDQAGIELMTVTENISPTCWATLRIVLEAAPGTYTRRGLVRRRAAHPAWYLIDHVSNDRLSLQLGHDEATLLADALEATGRVLRECGVTFEAVVADNLAVAVSRVGSPDFPDATLEVA